MPRDSEREGQEEGRKNGLGRRAGAERRCSVPRDSEREGKEERTEEWKGRKLRAPSGRRAALQSAAGQPKRRRERKDGMMERQEA